ncbi:hypothetical protein J4403_03395 [Candidatus Woesearchaeota archaeon]|nr:hypothetical protein [Candidatus Woesearchaeota archaeon]
MIKNKLIISTGVGYGHVTRDQAIAEKLSGKIFFAGYGCSYNYLKAFYPTIKISGIRFSDARNILKFRKLFIPANFVSLFYSIFDYFRLRKLIKKENIKVIISDNEPIAKFLSKKGEIKSVLIHNQNLKGLWKIIKGDYNSDMRLLAKLTKSLIEWGHKNADLVITPSLLGKTEHKGRYYSVGSIVRKSENKVSNNAILVMLGGSRFGLFMADKIIKLAEELNEQFIIFGYKEDLGLKNVKAFKFNPNFIDYLKDAKAVISLSGHSAISECLVHKKACLILPIQNHVEQYLNAKTVEKIYPVIYTEPSEKELKRQIKLLLKNRTKIENKIKKLRLKEGTELAAELINNL